VLINYLGSKAKLKRIDAHSTERDLNAVCSLLEEGKRIAYVSDAGTPGISDPGAKLVSTARSAGFSVVPIPGVSAVTALMSVSGFLSSDFSFHGFYPRKNNDQLMELNKYSHLGGVHVWFESPERIRASLDNIVKLFPNVQVIVAKELTKLFESFFVGNASEMFPLVAKHLESQGERGEWCFAIDFEKGIAESVDDVAWKSALICLKECGISQSQSVNVVCQQFGVRKNQIYSTALEIFKKSEQK
jgi:16S rRNA (cytidine1402-2'-O)-methyltransferase